MSALRVLLAAEPRHCPAKAAEQLVAHLDGRCAAVTVVGVATPPGRFEAWAPATGYVDLEQLRAEAAKAACLHARRLTEQLPSNVAVVHRAVMAWRDLVREAPAYDLVLLGGLPSRRRDRRLALRVAANAARSAA